MVGKMNQVLHRCLVPLPAKRKKVTTIEIIFYVYLVLNFMTLNENAAVARKVEFYDFRLRWEGVVFKIPLPIQIVYETSLLNIARHNFEPRYSLQ